MKKKLKQKYIILIFGPTGVGKSGFAERLAEHVPSQLVNCDIGQFYTPFSIGTAKPDWKASIVTQHLFDVIDEPRHFDVCQYRKLLLETVEKIWEQHQLPILVGGSGFYLKSLFFPPVSHDTIKKMRTEQPDTTCSLWEKLYQIDPQRALEVDKHDLYRIKRALDIWEKTGKKPSECLPVYDFPTNFLFLFLTRERKELYKRINERVFQMLHEGWIEEVEALMGTRWQDFLEQKKLIGYDIIIDYIKRGKKESEQEEMIKTIQKKTRNYAKRQITFFKSFKKQLEEAISSQEPQAPGAILPSKIESINLTLLDCDLYIKKLLNRLNPLYE